MASFYVLVILVPDRYYLDFVSISLVLCFCWYSFMLSNSFISSDLISTGIICFSVMFLDIFKWYHHHSQISYGRHSMFSSFKLLCKSLFHEFPFLLQTYCYIIHILIHKLLKNMFQLFCFSLLIASVSYNLFYQIGQNRFHKNKLEYSCIINISEIITFAGHLSWTVSLKLSMVS